MHLEKLMASITAAAVILTLGSCDDEVTDSNQPNPGKITATASGIVAQNGNIYSVMVYDYDWQPGATEPAIGGVMRTIDSDPFAFSSYLFVLDNLGRPTNVERVFDPATYSVVYFVSMPDQPPQHFAEVRAAVNGNITVAAPNWAAWIHP